MRSPPRSGYPLLRVYGSGKVPAGLIVDRDISKLAAVEHLPQFLFGWNSVVFYYPPYLVVQL